MKIKTDPKARTASFVVHPSLYSEDALRLAASVLESKAEAWVEPGRSGWKVELEAKRAAGAAELESLAREFLDEALNHEYRGLLSALNGPLSALLVTQALYAARGGDKPAEAPVLTPEQQAEVERLLAEAREEAARTMPKRIPSQGAPIKAEP